MNRATRKGEDRSSVNCGGSNGAIFRHSLVWLGIPLTAAIALIDVQALQVVTGRSAGWYVYAVYALFVLQMGAVSGIVGIQIQQAPSWWGILMWAILLLDLQVFAIAAPNNNWDVVKKLGFAIASSQIGLLTCFGVLGGTVWRIRLPIVGFGLALASLFAISLNGRDSWYFLLLLQCLATFVTCVVLRRIGFRIARLDHLPKDLAANKRLQFSIRHLFYWTTSVACVIAVGRLIGWRAMVGAGIEIGRTPELLLHVPLLTLVSIVGMWGALGREAWWMRLGMLSFSLPVVGFVFGFSARWTRSGGDNLFHRWRGGASGEIELGIVWTVLAGALLAGLLLVFRFSAHRLQRHVAG